MHSYYNDFIRLSSEKDIHLDGRDVIQNVQKQFPFRITPHYLSLIDWNDPHCPIAKQVLPSIKELTAKDQTIDACNENSILKYGCLLRRYEDRVLLLVSNECFAYCRFCTRKRLLGSENNKPSLDDIDKAIGFIKDNHEITEVILSGGDTLFLSDHYLERLLHKLQNIDHVRIVRIGTRAPITCPTRITPRLCKVLSRFDIVWVMVHFNHAREIVEDSTKACMLLRKSGIPILNQTVLLNGINNSVSELKKLFSGLVEIGVKPYYLYLCDKIPGTEHFWVPDKEIKSILKEFSQKITGLALPVFVIVDTNSWKHRFLFHENINIDRIFEEKGTK